MTSHRGDQKLEAWRSEYCSLLLSSYGPLSGIISLVSAHSVPNIENFLDQTGNNKGGNTVASWKGAHSWKRNLSLWLKLERIKRKGEKDYFGKEERNILYKLSPVLSCLKCGRSPQPADAAGSPPLPSWQGVGAVLEVSEPNVSFGCQHWDLPNLWKMVSKWNFCSKQDLALGSWHGLGDKSLKYHSMKMSQWPLKALFCNVTLSAQSRDHQNAAKGSIRQGVMRNVCLAPAPSLISYHALPFHPIGLILICEQSLWLTKSWSQGVSPSFWVTDESHGTSARWDRRGQDSKNMQFLPYFQQWKTCEENQDLDRVDLSKRRS